MVDKYDKEMGIDHGANGKAPRVAVQREVWGRRNAAMDKEHNIVLIGLEGAQDKDTREWRLAHEVAHQKTDNEFEADVLAARVIGPQKVIDALEKESKLSPSDSQDSHGTWRQRQQNIVDAFPNENLRIPSEKGTVPSNHVPEGQPLEPHHMTGANINLSASQINDAAKGLRGFASADEASSKALGDSVAAVLRRAGMKEILGSISPVETVSPPLGGVKATGIDRNIIS